MTAPTSKLAKARRGIVALALLRIEARHPSWMRCETADVLAELRAMKANTLAWGHIAKRWPWRHAITRELVHTIGRASFEYAKGEWLLDQGSKRTREANP